MFLFFVYYDKRKIASRTKEIFHRTSVGHSPYGSNLSFLDYRLCLHTLKKALGAERLSSDREVKDFFMRLHAHPSYFYYT